MAEKRASINVFEKKYLVRRINPKKNSFEVTVPAEFLAIEARKRGVTVEELIANHITAQFGDFNGVRFFYSE